MPEKQPLKVDDLAVCFNTIAVVPNNMEVYKLSRHKDCPWVPALSPPRSGPQVGPLPAVHCSFGGCVPTTCRWESTHTVPFYFLSFFTARDFYVLLAR